MSLLTDWIKKWFGEGTPDDWRNPFWRLTEHLAVRVSWSVSLFDFRFLYKSYEGQWVLFDLRLPHKTEQNVYNAFFSVQLYLVAWKWFVWPKLWVLIRPCHKYYLLASTPGLLFDRGEFQAKLALMNWEKERELGCNEPYFLDEGAI